MRRRSIAFPGDATSPGDMMRIQSIAARGLGLVAVTSVAAAMAQSPKLPDPSQPSAAAPAVEYESAFSDYQPFREQKIRSWKEVNQEVADNPGMGSMGAMKDMPAMGSTGAVKDMPGMNKDAPIATMSKEGHGAPAAAKPNAGDGKGQPAGVTGTGVVHGVDKANGKVKLTHDPIDALGWPKMTMFFRLKDGVMADHLNEGDRVNFSLERSAGGYVISSLQKSAPRH